MAYKPVPTSQKVCVHCHTVYYAKDQRRMYCSSSCNTKAWMARHGLTGSDQRQTKTKRIQAGGTLDPSLHNLALIAGTVLAADTTTAALNAVFEVQPTNDALLNEIKALRQQNAYLVHRLEAKIDAVASMVTDAKHGIAGISPSGRTALIASENRRQVLPPLPEPEPTGNPEPPKVDTAGR